MIQLGKKIDRFFLARLRVLLVCLTPILLLSACAGEKQGLAYDTLKLAFTSPHSAIDAAELNPAYRYLKVEANGQPALLVLGYSNLQPNSTSDIWYSAFKEVIEIKDGRLANTEGMDVNWTQVVLTDAPPLTEALVNTDPSLSKRAPRFRYSRMRTVMPGYHVNIRETVIMQALNDIPSDAPSVFKDPKTNVDIRWVEETVLVAPNNQNPSIKPLRAIYAINTKTKNVVFGKQFLNEHFFVSWLSWPYPSRVLNQTSESTPK
ncbi:YjbF family lipoprotein [Polynucleobacter sinensis]|uniref:YjbF family lipoprotein n=1 Tax=Polynucleobacter sinensis TaxID=1743157 RepID=UPI000781A8DC|nr:hypothetical protein [Polynucleobacter sinensis]